MIPEVSMVIPVHNEAGILDAALERFVGGLTDQGRSFELIVVENGSVDASAAIVRSWAQRDDRVVALHLDAPNYGGALRMGLLHARAPLVICEEIDVGASLFWSQALARLEQSPGMALVVGSKAMPGAADHRPWLRRSATVGYNGLLRIFFGYRGTDTHGVKVLRREAMLDIVQACRTQFDVFASELVIRAQRAGLTVLELPIRIRETRPSSVALHRRVPRLLSQLVRLLWAVYGEPAPRPGQVPKSPRS